MYLPKNLVMKILNPVIPEDITQEVPQNLELIIGIILYNYGNQFNHQRNMFFTINKAHLKLY
jgi:hypothetical protein